MERTINRTVASEIVRASEEVIGVKVINSATEDLGKIYDVCLDKLTGQTVYLVLESGSFLGLGGKLFAIPWNSIHYDVDEEAFVLNITKDKLKTAPGFDKDHWPTMADETFGKSISDYYGANTTKTKL